MAGASKIDFTFNWFYIDSKNIAYYVSGLDPVRPKFVDPNLPTWGTGGSEWRGFLPSDQHVHEIDPPQGFFDSWNNKPAPLFSASDSEYGYGPVYRVQMLTTQIRHQFALHHGKITRADLVQAMETAATQDLDGLTVLPALLSAVRGHAEPAGVARCWPRWRPGMPTAPTGSWPPRAAASTSRLPRWRSWTSSRRR